MSDCSDDDQLTPDEQRLLDWLGERSGRSDVQSRMIPPELRAAFQRLPAMLDCLQLLDSLAVPAGGGRGNSTASNSSSLHRLPRSFGPYELERELGRGGMGVVYLARHRTLNAHFALKLIRTSEFASEEEVRRFFREAQAASRLRHPHVVSVHDAGEIDGIPFLVMPFIGGESLARRLQRGRPSVEESVRWLIAVSRAVQYLHEQGIVHRDLKPGNILFDEQERPAVTDFGLAKLFDLQGERTTTGTVIGTPAYMAPEQAWGRSADVSPSSDIYSLGAIFYEMLTGRAPFPDQNPLDQILRLRDADPLSPRSIDPNIPMELEQICLRCLEKNPANRYLRGDELAADLERYSRGEPITLRPMGAWNGLRRWVRRQPALAMHLAAFASMAIIEQVANLMSGRQRAPYLPVMTVLIVWTALAVSLQKLLSRGIDSIKLLWVAVDAVLFTVAVSYADGPIESLVIGYSLLIAASGLWYQQRLVWLMTGVSVVSYGALLWWGEMGPLPRHYPFIVAGILVAVGGCVAMLVRRIRQLVNVQAHE